MGKSDDASGICKMFENKTSKIVCMVEKSCIVAKLRKLLKILTYLLLERGGKMNFFCFSFCFFFPDEKTVRRMGLRNRKEGTLFIGNK